MRPAEVTRLEVRDGWAALAVLEDQIAKDDPLDLRMLNRGRHLTPEEIHALVKSSILYIHGDIQRWATPRRTWESGYGDCGNSSRLTIALARFHGVPSRLRVFVRRSKDPGLLGRTWTSPAHVVAQLYDRGAWRWAESAIDARYGEHTLYAARRLGVHANIFEVPVAARAKLGKVKPAVRGRWGPLGLPPEVAIGGRHFTRARAAWPRRGVLAQYRETTWGPSAHLMVHRDGTWSVEHVDAENPDTGSSFRHFTRDVLPALGIGSVGDVGDEMTKQVPATKTPVAPLDMWNAMAAKFAARTGALPSRDSLMVLFAQAALETGNFVSMIQWNIGNVKHVANDGYDWTSYLTTECNPPGSDNCSQQTASFKAFDSLDDGLDFFFDIFQTGRYANAWPAVLAGDIGAFAAALSAHGYYTASVARYTAGMNARVAQFSSLPDPSFPLSALPPLLAIFLALGAATWGATQMGWVSFA